MALLLPLRLYHSRRSDRQLSAVADAGIPYDRLPGYAFLADLITWIGIGLLIAVIYYFQYGAWFSSMVSKVVPVWITRRSSR